MTEATPSFTQPTTEEITLGTNEVLASEGYVEDGQRKLDALRDAIYAAVVNARVDKMKERTTKALLRRKLVEVVLPSVPKPTDWPDADNPLLAEAIYKACSSLVWGQTTPTGPVQRRVGEADNGDFLCRTKITDDRLDALYVTSDLGCIEEDLFLPANIRWQAAAMTRSTLGVMLVERQPENGDKSLNLFQRAGRRVLDSGEGRIKDALEVSVDGSDEVSDE